jgi:hypothetical protein
VATFLVTVGIVLLAGAVVGGGLKVAGNEVPVLHTIERQFLTGALGVGLLVAGLLIHQSNHLKVTEVAIAPDQTSYIGCGVTVSFTGRISSTGKGSITYRFVRQGSVATKPQSRTVSGSSSFLVTDNFRDAGLPGLPHTNPTDTLEVLSPNNGGSETATANVVCV